MCEQAAREDLIRLYERYWPALVQLAADTEAEEQPLTGPHLICPSAAYFQQDKRLLVVGQDTQGWDWLNRVVAGEPREEIEGLMRDYSGCIGTLRSGLFWQGVRHFQEQLEIDGEVAWTNLNKIAQQPLSGSGWHPRREIQERVLSGFPVLPLEVQIIKPNMALFLSGPDFDHHIRTLFPGVEFREIGNYGERVVAQVVHTDLPRASLRLYHPQGMRLHGLDEERWLLQWVLRGLEWGERNPDRSLG